MHPYHSLGFVYKVHARIEAMEEVNPMLGFRGSKLKKLKMMTMAQMRRWMMNSNTKKIGSESSLSRG